MDKEQVKEMLRANGLWVEWAELCQTERDLEGLGSEQVKRYWERTEESVRHWAREVLVRRVWGVVRQVAQEVEELEYMLWEIDGEVELRLEVEMVLGVECEHVVEEFMVRDCLRVLGCDSLEEIDRVRREERQWLMRVPIQVNWDGLMEQTGHLRSVS